MPSVYNYFPKSKYVYKVESAIKLFDYRTHEHLDSIATILCTFAICACLSQFHWDLHTHTIVCRIEVHILSPLGSAFFLVYVKPCTDSYKCSLFLFSTPGVRNLHPYSVRHIYTSPKIKIILKYYHLFSV